MLNKSKSILMGLGLILGLVLIAFLPYDKEVKADSLYKPQDTGVSFISPEGDSTEKSSKTEKP